MPVTPIAGANSVIAVGGTAVIAVNANSNGVNGGYIVNPLTTTDQGVSPVEVLIVDPTGVAPGSNANGTAIALQPGQSFPLIPGQTTAVQVNAATTGHKFTCVIY